MILCTSRHILLDGFTLASSPCFASLRARSVAAQPLLQTYADQLAHRIDADGGLPA